MSTRILQASRLKSTLQQFQVHLPSFKTNKRIIQFDLILEYIVFEIMLPNTMVFENVNIIITIEHTYTARKYSMTKIILNILA